MVMGKLLVLLTMVCITSGAAAQSVSSGRAFAPVDSGKVIRFQVGGSILRGRLLQPMTPASDSVLYCLYPAPACTEPLESRRTAWVQLRTMEHLEVEVGTLAARGAVIGGIGGVVSGLLIGSIVVGLCEYDCPSGTELGFALVVHAGVWAGVGALFGSASPRLESRF